MCCRLHPREAAPRVLTRSHLSCLVSMHYLSDTPLSGEQIWPKSPAELLIKASSECMHALWCNFVYMRSCISLHCARGCRRNIMHAFVSSPSPCLRAQTVWARVSSKISARQPLSASRHMDQLPVRSVEMHAVCIHNQGACELVACAH